MYKIILTINIKELNSGRFSDKRDTVRLSNNGLEFVTQLKTGIAPEEGEVFLSHPETIELMSTKPWRSQEI